MHLLCNYLGTEIVSEVADGPQLEQVTDGEQDVTSMNTSFLHDLHQNVKEFTDDTDEYGTGFHQ